MALFKSFLLKKQSIAIPKSWVEVLAEVFQLIEIDED